uniref:Chloroplast outer envelope protein n=1 Tax=Gonium pectorale TaxID=33097 RepID=A0A140JWU4_GONPE|nr:chloroplast outer envelope protein [Gonium pectorale]
MSQREMDNEANIGQESDAAAELWTGLARLPEKNDIIELLRELRGAGRKQLTILLLGKSNVGKSSLVNSLLGEDAMRVQAFKLQADAEVATVVTRQVSISDDEIDGFRIRLIDTCGLEDSEAGDTVNLTALKKIADDLRGVPIDVVLYVDRLDLYRVDSLDQAVMRAISQVLGQDIWSRTVVALTHANLSQPPPGTSYDSYVDGRVRLLRAAVPRRFLFRPKLPTSLVENSLLCPLSPESGHRVLPDGTEWLVGLMGDIVDVALAKKRAYEFRSRPNQKALIAALLLPLAVAGEYLLFQKVIRPVLESNQRRVEADEQRVWTLRGLQRKAMGLHAANKPSDDVAKRLSQMYDDD